MADREPRMAKFVQLWASLPKEVCSDDEQVAGSNASARYEKIAPYWRNPEIQDFFNSWDHIDIALRYGPDGKPQGKGRFPRVRTQREPPRKDYEAPAVKNLPTNFYDPLWYESLDEMEKIDLGAQPAVDLTFPSRILRYVLPDFPCLNYANLTRLAHRHAHIRTRADRPLPS